MKVPLLLGWMVLVAVACGQEDPKKEVYTPPADVAGSWDFTPDPALPNVLILGDSISIGYTRDVRAELAGKANVFRPMNAKNKNSPENCGDTEMGLEGLDGWLGGQKWSVIHCNWGLWDLCYRVAGKPKAGNRDKVNGKIAISTEEYVANLDKIVTRLQATGAKVIWASTTWIPEAETGRVAGDEVRYNAAAAALMEKKKVPVDDLHALTAGWAGKHSKAVGDVHYTAAGSGLLGKQVAAAIAAHLSRSPAQP
jgi:hypothetical protein